MGLRFEAVSSVSAETIARHKSYSRSLGLPVIKPGKVGAAAPSLAVVGGAPSINDHLDELRGWDGEIWAVNYTWVWCRDNGIDATLYTIDPVFPGVDGVARAVLGDFVSPALLSRLIAEGTKIEIVPLGTGKDEHQHVTTSAGTVPFFAHWRGHRHITFFGCDSSKTAGQGHAYKHPKGMGREIIVECGGGEYLTSPQMLMQAEEMAKIVRRFPSYITVRCNGLLPALVKHGEHDVVKVCKEIYDTLEVA